MLTNIFQSVEMMLKAVFHCTFPPSKQCDTLVESVRLKLLTSEAIIVKSYQNEGDISMSNYPQSSWKITV